MRYFEQKRIAFVTETLNGKGFVNRRDLIEKFQISVAQASKDLNKFMRLYPDVMKYDSSAKRFVLKGAQ